MFAWLRRKLLAARLPLTWDIREDAAWAAYDDAIKLGDTQ